MKLNLDLSLIKQPPALLSIGLSLAGLALIFGHLALFGNMQQEDEGTAAHLWQLIMLVQLPVIGWFLFRWLPRKLMGSLQVFALLAALWLLNLLVLLRLEAR